MTLVQSADAHHEAQRLMHYEVLFLALTTSLLNLDDTQRGPLFSQVESSFEGLEFRKLRVPGHTSVGARLLPNVEKTLYDWIEGLRKDGLRCAGIPLLETSQTLTGLLNGLTPMQQQAYRGGTLRLIVCEFATHLKYFVLEMESSAPHKITATQFGDFLVDQPAADAIWQDLLNDVQATDGAEVSNAEQMREFFYTRTGAKAFASNGDSFLLTAQSAAQRVGSRLVVSQADEEFFTIGDNAESLHEMLGGAPEEFIPFEDILVLNGNATAPELARLFDAQVCGPAVWERVAASLIRIGELESGLKPSDWRTAFLALVEEKVDIYTRSFIQALQEACRACNCHLKITHEFEGRLQTYIESLDPAARAAHVPSDQRLHFTPNREPWNHFYFSEVGSLQPSAVSAKVASMAVSAKAASGSVIQPAVASAQQAMRLGYAFSTRIGTPYAKVFALVNLILSGDSDVLFEGRMSIEDYLFEIQTQGHEHEMQERLATSWPLMELLRALQLCPLQLKALCASSLADVFDGTGDWGDSYFDDPADQKEFEEISQTVFQTMLELQTAALSLEEMGASGVSDSRQLDVSKNTELSFRKNSTSSGVK